MLGAYMAHAQVVDSTKNIDSTQQDNFVIDYANAKTFKLKDVLVTGDTKFSKNQIIRYAGFAIGEEIELPGTKVNNAVKKLWRSNLFSDIDLYVAKIEGDHVTLELALISVPTGMTFPPPEGASLYSPKANGGNLYVEQEFRSVGTVMLSAPIKTVNDFSDLQFVGVVFVSL